MTTCDCGVSLLLVTSDWTTNPCPRRPATQRRFLSRKERAAGEGSQAPHIVGAAGTRPTVDEQVWDFLGESYYVSMNIQAGRMATGEAT